MSAGEDRSRSAVLFARAQEVIVGGVSSPVRAFRAVGGDPVFVERAEGARIYDVDGREYIDLVGSWGPAIVGHAHPKVVEAVCEAAESGLSFGACCAAEEELAAIIVGAIPSIEVLRFVNSGTEATMSAVRLARAATGRDKVIKFQGCYHGHADALLVSAGSGASTLGTPDSAGVTASAVRDTLQVSYNDLEAVASVLTRCGKDVAAILVEPVAGNMGFVAPADGFLQGLRDLCDEYGSLLVFDEVMTGFRVAWGGFQNIVNIKPDITCLGKVIGGGMPVAAYGGSRELMQQVSPLGPMYQAGTLSGNPVGMAAGIATLGLCQSGAFYEDLGRRAATLAGGLKSAAADYDIAMQSGSLGGMLGIAFLDHPVRDFKDAQACDHELFRRFFWEMLRRGVWLPPSGYEAMFVSCVHGEQEIQAIIEAAMACFGSMCS